MIYSGEIDEWKYHPAATQPTCSAKREKANGRDYIYRVTFSSTSSFRSRAGAFIALEGPSQSNLAAEGHNFDVLKVDLTCVCGFINLGWKAGERTD